MRSLSANRNPISEPSPTTMAASSFARSEPPKARHVQSRVLRTNHADIALKQTAGTKLPVLFLHGGGLCKEVFDRQLESALGDQYRMIAIDWPGHGASSPAFNPDRTCSIEGLADLALEVLERLDIDNAVVVGASLGGRVGLEMIQTFPGLLGLMLTGVPLDVSTLGSQIDLPEFALSGEPGLDADRIDVFLRRSLGDLDAAPFRGAVEHADKPSLDRIAQDMKSPAHPWPTAASVSGTPILTVDGENGAVGNIRRQAGGRRELERLVIAQSGPAPFLETPSLFNHLLKRFLQRMARREQQWLTSPPLWYGG